MSETLKDDRRMTPEECDAALNCVCASPISGTRHKFAIRLRDHISSIQQHLDWARGERGAEQRRAEELFNENCTLKLSCQAIEDVEEGYRKRIEKLEESLKKFSYVIQNIATAGTPDPRIAELEKDKTRLNVYESMCRGSFRPMPQTDRESGRFIGWRWEHKTYSTLREAIDAATEENKNV